jgi:cholesterol oxidase
MNDETESVPPTTDYLVVGSGFGGSVMAATLTGPGRTVCVLERGKAYPPGSFPRSPDGMATNFWDPSEGLYGLFNVWSFEHVDSIVASGLGGGSLIYANVMVEKPAGWFTQPMPDDDGAETWSFSSADLAEHYDAVKRFLGVGPLPEQLAPDASPKTKRFIGALGDGAEYAPLAVRFEDASGSPAIGAPLPPEDYGSIFGTPRRTTCRMIGECDFGCNEGAKSSMDHTYLSKAHADGASIHTRTEVRALRRLDGVDGYHFEVSYVVHPRWAEGRRRDTGCIPVRTIKAKRVVLAAGAMGTTFLMLKNRYALGVPEYSPVGERFCDNGDLLSVALPVRDTQDYEASKGPVITALRRYEPGESGSVRMYLEDGGVPNVMLWVLKTLDAPGLIGRLATRGLGYWWHRVTNSNDNNVSAEASRVMGISPAIGRSLPILGMGEDVANGRLSLTAEGILENSWTPRDSNPYFFSMRETMNALKRSLGAEVEARVKRDTKRTITVHPLGGCPADTSRFSGVVDSFGHVHGVPGLWIADGSVMPGPVGANPSLTIAAFARRAAMQLLDEGLGSPPTA